MFKHFIDDLVCPVQGTSLNLESPTWDDSFATAGALISEKSGRKCRHEIRDGVPDFVGELEPGENQVHQVFSEYWKTFVFNFDRPGKRDLYYDQLKRLFMLDRLPEPAGREQLTKFLNSKSRILDAGCGSAWISRFYRANETQKWYCADFGQSVFLAQKELRNQPNTLVTRASVFELPFKEKFFDLIVSYGVLHHTPDPKLAFQRLVRHLAPGGDICIGMIRKQAPIREFTDAFVRDHVTALPFEKGLEFARSMYELSKEIQSHDIKIKVPSGLEFMGFDAGEYTLHRFLHAHIMKCFYSPHFSEQENIMQQVDWYVTKYGWPHTEEELVEWYKEAGLTDIQLWKPHSPAEKNEIIRIKGTLKK